MPYASSMISDILDARERANLNAINQFGKPGPLGCCYNAGCSNARESAISINGCSDVSAIEMGIHSDDRGTWPDVSM